MSVSAQQAAAPPPPPASPTAGGALPARLWSVWLAAWDAADWEQRGIWLTRAAGVVVLLCIPLGLLLFPQAGLHQEWPRARLVWTMIVALLPAFIVVVGFYRWREICPLASFSRMSEWIGWPDRPTGRESERRRRRVSPWLVTNYPYVTWGILAAALAHRLLLINSHPLSLALAFMAVIAAAVGVGFVYTGKSWCNFFCPVGVIERVYLDADRPLYHRNSQCARCTGCKTVPSGGLCPDINQENDYWQELSLRSRQFVFYATPGLFLGFYVWYFLHQPYYWHRLQAARMLGDASYPRPIPYQIPGTRFDWGYYLSGDWTRDPAPWLHWLDPGFGFTGAPYVPVLLAAPLTLAFFSALTWGAFVGLEHVWTQWKLKTGSPAAEIAEHVRHPLFVWAGFLTFCTFYLFAGAPTFRTLPPGGYETLHFLLLLLATRTLYTRLARTRRKQLQNDQARKWVRRWPWPERPPRDLDEAYTTYTLRTHDSDNRLRAFKDAVTHMLSENLVTSQELGLLDRLAQDLGLSDAEQQRVLRELAREAPEFFDPTYKGTLGERLRLIGYRTELEQLLTTNKGILPDERTLADLQEKYRLRPEEHEEVVQELSDPQGARGQHLRNELKRVQIVRRDLALLSHYTYPVIQFLEQEMQGVLAEDMDHLLRLANLYGPPGELDAPRALLASGDQSGLEHIANWLDENLPPDLAAACRAAICEPVDRSKLEVGPVSLTGMLLRLSSDQNVYLRAAAVYALRYPLSELGTPVGSAGSGAGTAAGARQAALARVGRALKDRHPLLREAAATVLLPDVSAKDWEALFADEAASVRRLAIHRLPDAPPGELLHLVRNSLKDPDVEVWRGAQDRMRRRILPGSKAGWVPLSSLERMFALRQSTVLARLPTDALQALAQRAFEQAFREGEALCREGDVGGAAYFLLDGEAEVTVFRDGQPVRVNMCRTGDCLGEIAALDGGPRTATVTAFQGEVRALVVRPEDFRAVVEREAPTAMSLVRVILERQRQQLEIRSTDSSGNENPTHGEASPGR